jgi:MraZ protein
LFRGRSAHVLDSKGRLSIPARFRDILRAKYDGRLVVTNHPPCLTAYPFDEWRAVEEKFLHETAPTPELLSLQRYFLAAAVECFLDGQGRILLPVNLREEAGIGKEVVLSGMLRHFEIWSKDLLDEELRKVRENFDQYSRIISKIGSGSI